MEKSDFLKFEDKSERGIKKFVEGLFVIYMPTIVGAKIISNQFILLKNKTKNCLHNLQNTRNVELNAGNVVLGFSCFFPKDLLI